jgi:hypothetical protein
MDLSEVEKFERAKVGTIKLSEAIRIGASKRPQAFSISFSPHGGSCAIGAAYEGAFGKTGGNYLQCGGELKRAGIWPEGLPLCEVYFLNDTHKWSREAIADWLEAQGY